MELKVRLYEMRGNATAFAFRCYNQLINFSTTFSNVAFVIFSAVLYDAKLNTTVQTAELTENV
jgi:hypothetical protein